MEARIIVQFGMESRRQLIPLPGSHDVSADLCQYPAVGRQHLINIWRADESHRNVLPDFCHILLCVKAAQLASVGITADTHLHRGEMGFGQQDESGTCAEYGKSLADGLSDRPLKAQLSQKFHLSGRFSAREDQAILGSLPVGGLAHLKGLNA